MSKLVLFFVLLVIVWLVSCDSKLEDPSHRTREDLAMIARYLRGAYNDGHFYIDNHQIVKADLSIINILRSENNGCEFELFYCKVRKDSISDQWGNTIEISREFSILRVTSPGKNGMSGDEDDVVYETSIGER